MVTSDRAEDEESEEDTDLEVDSDMSPPKAKKAKVIKYLEDRAAEMAAGLGYHRPGTEERSRIEAKRTLVLLLKVMVENDGRLSGR